MVTPVHEVEGTFFSFLKWHLKYHGSVLLLLDRILAVYFLAEHSQRLNRLTLTLICLTVILLMATITDIIVRVA